MTDMNQPAWEVLDIERYRTAQRSELERLCRGRTQYARLDGERMVARVLGRYKLFLDSRDRGFAPHLLLDGYWEIWLTQFIARRLKAGSAAIDVGANYGYFSVLMADLVGPSGHLLCLEPNPAPFDFLQQSMAINGFTERSHLLMAAAGAVSRSGTLFVPQGEPKNGTLVATDIAPQLTGGLSMDVAIHRLDELWPADRQLDFLKIDAEGAEEDVIEGMWPLIERWRPEMVLEFNPHRCRAPAGLLQRLSAAYGSPRVVSSEGEAAAITTEQVLTLDSRDDRLLFFSMFA